MEPGTPKPTEMSENINEEQLVHESETSSSDKEDAAEKLLKEKIAVINNIPTGSAGKSQILLILLGKKLATEMIIQDENIVPEILENLKKIGLSADIIEKRIFDHIAGVNIGIAISDEILEEFRHIESTKNHRRYGELMGFPSSAIDGFLRENGNEPLEYEEQYKMTEGFPNALCAFRFSKNNKTEEFEIFKRKLKLIARYAPEFIYRTYHKKTADEFIKNLLTSEDK